MLGSNRKQPKGPAIPPWLLGGIFLVLVGGMVVAWLMGIEVKKAASVLVLAVIALAALGGAPIKGSGDESEG